MFGTNPVMRLRLPTQHVQCNPLWLFWPISLLLHLTPVRSSIGETEKISCSFTSFLQEFLSFLKNTEIVSLNTYAGATDHFFFSKCNPIHVRFPHYTLMIHWVIPWSLHRDSLTWAFEKKQFSKQFIWTGVKKSTVAFNFWMDAESTNFYTRLSLSPVFAFSFCQGK